MINGATKQDALARLKKIEGQIKGIQRMVEEEKYCVDIINQINAIRRALEQVALGVMKRHVNSCVSDAIKKDKAGGKVEELMETIDRFIR